ncbi:MAG: OadG family protein [Clostridia bacterium]|nr:OadG family protein [Clostridia bacterium]
MTLSLLQMQLGLGDTLKTSGVGFVIVLVVLAFIAVLIKLISGVFSKTIGKEKTEAKADVSAAAPSAPVTAPAPVAAAPVTPGYLRLEGVSEANAAVIMALVSHQTGIPINRLAFHSIKCLQDSVELIDVDEPTAAVIMAIVSDTSGIPLERLDFSSIRLIKEN